MARFWVAAGTTNWNDTAGWATSSGGTPGASVPDSAEDVTFNGSGLGNCTVNAAIDIASLNIIAAYTGHFDNATNDQVVQMSGNCTLAGGGTVSMGDATWSPGGNFACSAQVTFNRNLSTIVMTGTSKTFGCGTTNDVYNLTINSGATITTTGGGNHDVANTLTVNGSLTTGGSLRITSTLSGNGTITGAGSVNSVNGANFGGFTGTISTASLGGDRQFTVPPCNINCPFTYTNEANSVVLLFAAGTTTFGGDVTIVNDAGSMTVNCSTNHPTIIFKEDLTITIAGGSGIAWSKGNGTITFSGTSNQSIDFEAKAVEDLILNKTAGTVTLAANATTDSLTLTDGTLDINSKTLAVVGALTAAAGVEVTDTGNAGLITVGGNLALNGTSGGGNGVTWTGANLQVVGTATAEYTTATNSDATGGTQIDADSGTSTDGGGNTNWLFTVTTVEVVEVIEESSHWVCPRGVTVIQVEAWGAGGGGNGSDSFIGAGGGGGAYAMDDDVTVVPLTEYFIAIGAGGSGGSALSNGDDGEDTIFGDGTAVLAAGGQGAQFVEDADSIGGLGGAAADCVGETTTDATNGGGGGSGGASPNGGAGGTPPGGGGPGNPGVIPGGGGSAGMNGASGSDIGGNGARGQVVLTYAVTPQTRHGKLLTINCG